MQYQAFDGQPEIEGTETLEDIFRQIEINARSSGKTDLLLMLDRVPGQIIGHENSRDNDLVEHHLACSLETLRSVRVAMNEIGGARRHQENE